MASLPPISTSVSCHVHGGKAQDPSTSASSTATPATDSFYTIQRLGMLVLEQKLQPEIISVATVLYGPTNKYASFLVIVANTDVFAEIAAKLVPQFQAKLVGFLKDSSDWEMLYMSDILRGPHCALDQLLIKLRHEFAKTTASMANGNTILQPGGFRSGPP